MKANSTFARRAALALGLTLLGACPAKQSPGLGATTQPPTAGSGAPAGTAGTSAVASTTLPCAVSQILADNCQSCHGATPLNGAPMSMVTLTDLTAPARTDMSRKVFQLVPERIADRSRPMPPDPTKRLTDAQIATLQTWSSSGAPGGAACAATGAAGTGTVVAAGQAGSGTGAVSSSAAGGGGQAAPGAGSSAGNAGQGGAGSFPGDADIENCYDLLAHGQPTPGDKTDYTVPTGETYTSFIFKAPWTKPVQALRFRHLPDNVAVLHHWLLYSESASLDDGAIDACALAGPQGFLCGQASTRSLITGWAPGRGDFRLPSDAGLEMPAPGALMAIEFHYYNTTSGMTAADHSGVEICVTTKFRPNTASVTWLGTTSINLPAHMAGTATGTCKPLRMGMNATDPIHVLFSWPHMHKLGTHMNTTVTRAAGGTDVLYDGDFTFQFQVLHDTPLLLQAGDTLATTCSYQNSTDGTVTFGQSTGQEMCFNFTYAWPAHALDNPGAALGGASNTCEH